MPLAADRAEVSLHLGTWRRCHAAARQSHTRIRILRRGGLPFALRRLRRRPVLLGGAAAILIGLWILSGFFWAVEVQGGDAATSARVLAAAAALGLRPGGRRGAVDAQRVAEELPSLVSSVAWAGIRIQGVRATIQVAERSGSAAPTGEGPAGDLVAAADGVVERVTVLRGQARVRPGQTVVRGEVLIAGRQASEPRGDASATGVPVTARGTVLARVWYHKTTEVALRRSLAVDDGVPVVRWRVRLFGWTVGLGTGAPLPFADYRLDMRVYAVRLRDVELPLQVQALIYQPVRRVWRLLTPQEATADGATAAEADIRQHLPGGAAVQSVAVRSLPAAGDRVIVTVTMQVSEDIARARPNPAPGP